MMNGSLFSVPANSGALPATVDWRKGRGGGRAVTPVKDQNCGDCWAEFSTSMSRRGPKYCWRQLSYAIKNQLVASKAPY